MEKSKEGLKITEDRPKKKLYVFMSSNYSVSQFARYWPGDWKLIDAKSTSDEISIHKSEPKKYYQVSFEYQGSNDTIEIMIEALKKFFDELINDKILSRYKISESYDPDTP